MKKLTEEEISMILSATEDAARNKPVILLASMRNYQKYCDHFEFESRCGLHFHIDDIIKKITNITGVDEDLNGTTD